MSKYHKYGLWLVVAAAILFVLTACGGGPGQTIDPPQVDYDEEGAWWQVLETVATVGNEPSMMTVLYVLDENELLTPISVETPLAEGVAKQSLQFLVAGGPVQSMLPQQFRAVLPKDTQILGLDVTDGIAVVDFSESFVHYPLQDERRILEAVVWTLTQYPTIDQVEIRVEGQPLFEMPMGGIPLEGRLSRNMGINLSWDLGVELSRSQAVTVYYAGLTMEEEFYFVPVTRLVSRHQNQGVAAIQELIRGPHEFPRLAQLIPEGADIIDLQKHELQVTVNLNQAWSDSDGRVSDAALQALVLTLGETMQVESVQLLLEGDASFVSKQDRTFTEPVETTQLLNPFLR